MTTMASKRDYYEVLGVTRECSAVVVKKAYKKLALANHPDRNPGDDEAIERFKEASEAFEVLSDAEKKSRYDRFGHEGVSGAGGAGFSDLGDIFDAFGDLFGGAFGGGGGRGRRQQRAQQGNSLQTSTEIDLLEAAKGCTQSIEIGRQELCSTCDGSGAKPGSEKQTCDYCAGHGRVVQSQGFFRVQTTCPACRGEGAIIRDKCRGCGGSGRELKTAKRDIHIPPGIDNGMRLRVSGEGEPGPNGGPRGDLYVDINVAEHPFFDRDGNDLICNVPISYTQAALGAVVEIPTLEGRHNLQIPSGTQPGDTFYLRGDGMPDPHGGRTGDLVVNAIVEVPRKLTDRQEELLRELAETEHKDVTPHRQTFFEKLKGYFSHEEEEDESLSSESKR